MRIECAALAVSALARWSTLLALRRLRLSWLAGLSRLPLGLLLPGLRLARLPLTWLLALAGLLGLLSLALWLARLLSLL